MGKKSDQSRGYLIMDPSETFNSLNGEALQDIRSHFLSKGEVLERLDNLDVPPEDIGETDGIVILEIKNAWDIGAFGIKVTIKFEPE